MVWAFASAVERSGQPQLPLDFTYLDAVTLLTVEAYEISIFMPSMFKIIDVFFFVPATSFFFPAVCTLVHIQVLLP